MTTINQDLIHIELSTPLNTTTQLKCENCGRHYTPTEIQYILDHYPHEQTWEEHSWRIHGNHEHKPLNRHSRDATTIIQARRANGCYGENYYGNINNYPDQTHIPQELQQIAQQLAQHAHQLLPHN